MQPRTGSVTVEVSRRELQALRIAIRPVAHLDRGVAVVEAAIGGRMPADGFVVDVISKARDSVQRDIRRDRYADQPGYGSSAQLLAVYEDLLWRLVDANARPRA
jgi:hypothetical protein